jgi:hypothetical protein
MAAARKGKNAAVAQTAAANPPIIPGTAMINGSAPPGILGQAPQGFVQAPAFPTYFNTTAMPAMQPPAMPAQLAQAQLAAAMQAMANPTAPPAQNGYGIPTADGGLIPVQPAAQTKKGSTSRSKVKAVPAGPVPSPDLDIIKQYPTRHPHFGENASTGNSTFMSDVTAAVLALLRNRISEFDSIAGSVNEPKPFFKFDAQALDILRLPMRAIRSFTESLSTQGSNLKTEANLTAHIEGNQAMALLYALNQAHPGDPNTQRSSAIAVATDIPTQLITDDTQRIMRTVADAYVYAIATKLVAPIATDYELRVLEKRPATTITIGKDVAMTAVRGLNSSPQDPLNILALRVARDAHKYMSAWNDVREGIAKDKQRERDAKNAKAAADAAAVANGVVNGVAAP